MANWPRFTERDTQQKYLQPAQRMVIGGADGMTAFRDQLISMVKAMTSTGMYPEPTTLGDTKATFTDALVGSAYELSLGSVRHGVAAGRIITLDPQTSPTPGSWLRWNNAEHALYDAAYERAAGVTYYISTAYVAYPDPAIASGGALHYKLWNNAMGAVAAPASVTDDGDGTMTFDVTGVTGLWGVGAGAWGAGGKRRCIVWRNNPRINSSLSVYAGDIESDGTSLTISVPHTFGMNSPTVVAADYKVFVPGLIISRGAYIGGWKLGTITDGVFDDADQRLSALPQELGALVDELQRRVLHPSRPGCFFGKLDVTRDVANACSVSHSAPNVTATLTDPGSVAGVPDDWRIFTAGRMVEAFKSGGLSVSMADTEPTDNYMVYVDVEEVGGLPQAKLAITDYTDYQANHADKLPLRLFNFNTSTNVVSGQTPGALEAYRLGGLPPGLEEDGLAQHVLDLIFYPHGGAEAETVRGKVALRAEDGASAVPALRAYRADQATDLDFTNVAQQALALTLGAAGHALLRIYGPGGRDALPAGDLAGLELGKRGAGIGIYQEGAATDAAMALAWALKADPANDVLMRLLQSGGVQSDQVNSARPVVKVPDLQLLGSNGKLVTRGIWPGPWCHAINTNGVNGWVFDSATGIWQNVAKGGGLSSDDLYVLIPHAGTPGRSASGAGGSDGEAAHLCRVIANCAVSGGSSSDTILGDIVEVDFTNANPFTDSGSGGGTTVRSASQISWATGNDGAKTVEIAGSTDADSVPVGIDMDPDKSYFLRFGIATNAGAESPLRRALVIKTVYRTFELGAGAP